MVSISALEDISVTTFKIRLKRPFTFGSFERVVKLRWLDDAIEWADKMGYRLSDIEEISFEQDGVQRDFQQQEIADAIARFNLLDN